VAIVGASAFIVGTLTVQSSLTVSVIAAVVIAALFHPLRIWTENVVDRYFFNVRYNYREAVKRFIDKVIYCYDDASICATLVGTVEALIPNEGTVVFLVDGHGTSAHEELIPLLRMHAPPLALSEQMELGAVFTRTPAGTLNGGTTAAAFRIHSESSGLLGGLLMGKKRSGFRYTLEDVDLLESFCHQAALSLDRVHLQRTLISEQMEKNRFRELNELKSYFVSSVTHELKTPLTSIRLFTELIEGAPRLGKDKRREYLEIIKGESERLSRLIDNVLDVARIEKGLTQYTFSPVDLNECVREALRTMEFQLRLHGFECKTHLARRRPAILADKDAILEVLINLLTNSIKYSSTRKTIVIATRHTEGGICLEVEDFGVGIAPEDMQKIFEPFERTDSSLVKHTAGTGLGLALVKHIAEAHKAALAVESEPGKRTKFSITFPTHTPPG